SNSAAAANGAEGMARSRGQTGGSTRTLRIIPAMELTAGPLFRFRDQLRDPGQFFLCDTRTLAAKERAHHLLGRSIEEGVDEMSQRRSPCRSSRDGGAVDVTQSRFFVADLPFFLEHAQLRAHRRVVWF